MARGLIRPNSLGKENTRCVTSGKVTLLGEVSPVVVSFQIGCCKFKYSCSLKSKGQQKQTHKWVLKKTVLKIFEKLTFVSESLYSKDAGGRLGTLLRRISGLNVVIFFRTPFL